MPGTGDQQSPPSKAPKVRRGDPGKPGERKAPNHQPEGTTWEGPSRKDTTGERRDTPAYAQRRSPFATAPDARDMPRTPAVYDPLGSNPGFQRQMTGDPRRWDHPRVDPPAVAATGRLADPAGRFGRQATDPKPPDRRSQRGINRRQKDEDDKAGDLGDQGTGDHNRH